MYEEHRKAVILEAVENSRCDGCPYYLISGVDAGTPYWKASSSGEARWNEHVEMKITVEDLDRR